MMPYGVSELGHRRFRQWLVTRLVPSHYTEQCWNVVNFEHIYEIQIKTNYSFKCNQTCSVKMGASLSRLQYFNNTIFFNTSWPRDAI